MTSVSPANPSVPAAADSGRVLHVGCITTGRADSGIYRPLLSALAAERGWQVTCLAGGTHHTERFGRTIDDLADIAGVDLVNVDHYVAGDGPVAVAATAAKATDAFSRAFADVKVDLLFVLGDRTEMLAAALAALIHKIPIAHLHGGDVTEGACDEQCRHAITKMAHLHFPAMEQHAARILAMGEEAWRVRAVGALALDSLRGFVPESVDALNRAVGLDLSRRTIVVVFHPQTLAPQSPRQQVGELAAALRSIDANLLMVGPNADVGHAAISEVFEALAASTDRAVVVPSLPQHRFWSCLAHADALVGNSSAGLLEASGLRLPVVNIGGRQEGRIRPANVIDAPAQRDGILEAIRQALDPQFHESITGLVSPYGDGHAAERIVAVLRVLPDRQTLLQKRRPTPL